MNNKLGARDFINIGIFTVIFIAVFMICLMVVSMVPVGFPFAMAIAGLVLAPIYMLLIAKCPKTGTIFILFAIYGLMTFIMGSGWPIALSALIGGAIAELITAGKNKTNFFLQSISYAIVMVCINLGSLIPLFMMKDYYNNLATTNTIQEKFMGELLSFMTGPVLIIATIAAFVCSLLGAYIAKAILKKHFVKAGFVRVQS